MDGECSICAKQQEEKPNFLKLIYFFKLFCVFIAVSIFHLGKSLRFFGESFRVGREVGRVFHPSTLCGFATHSSDESDDEEHK